MALGSQLLYKFERQQYLDLLDIIARKVGFFHKITVVILLLF